MASVSFRSVRRQYAGNDQPAVADIDLDVADGEFMVLVGPSGCGKSTTLRMLAGLEEVDAGFIFIGDQEVTQMAPKQRDIAMVFQNYALYPHMSVAENMGFSLKMSGVGAGVRRTRVAEVAEMLDLQDLLHRKPKALSGGQRQRVAMGRAIVRRPQVFCMDEPLSNLDAKMRVRTRSDIAQLQRELGVTTIYVTHDQVEAMTMGDRVAVMKDGVLQQVDSPLRLYDKPENLFVAGFIGTPQMNLLRGRVDGDHVRLGGVELTFDAAAGIADGRDVTIGVRPESWRLVGSGGGLPVEVTMIEELGADGYAYGTSDVDGTPHAVVVRLPVRGAAQKGTVLYLATDPANVHVFDSSTGERLSD